MGIKIDRYFTTAKKSVYDSFRYELRDVQLNDHEGNVIFRQTGVEVPSHWSRLATDILAQKYFRRTGVPQKDDGEGGEYSIRQVVHRMADCWVNWGNKYGYFATPEDSSAFYDETVFMLLGQYAAPNSPQWFNTGLSDAYGIEGPSQGHYYIDPADNECKKCGSAFERPQSHACFILSVKDDLLEPGGIMDLLLREARVFKFGSGAGTNYSKLRAKNEPLSGGGVSSGVMSFLRVGDAAAGAIRSGGITRRAAKMVCLDADHPEIESFIRWKADEEVKAEALMKAGYSSGFEGEAYRSVSGQHSNNTVRFPDSFFQALDHGGAWDLHDRTTGLNSKSVPARELWSLLASAAWRCADPGVQFDTTINEWHTCPVGGRIHASNPCAEFLFLDDSSCNLASINLMRFINRKSVQFDLKGFQHACRIWTIALEIAVLMAQYPSPEVARISFDYRPIGLGYTNLGTFCMANGWPYDSAFARSAAAALAAVMTATAYQTSAEMGAAFGPFARFTENKAAMLRVVKNHRAAITGNPLTFDSLTKMPRGIDRAKCPTEWIDAAQIAFDRAIELGEKTGFRNAQVTVVAPTGTIGLLMDCDTMGIEPEYSLVKQKHLAGGGSINMINRHIPVVLQKLGYAPGEIEEMMEYLIQQGTFSGCDILRKKHRPIFATAVTVDAQKEFSISTEGHLQMIASVQPFISGGISKTLNLPSYASVREIESCFLKAWQYGLKSLAVYRDGCKSSQPLTKPFRHEKGEYQFLCAACGHPGVVDEGCFRCVNCGNANSCG